MKKCMTLLLAFFMALSMTACNKRKEEHLEEESSMVDFVVEVEENREIKILQLTDPQIMDCGQARLGGDREQYRSEPISDAELFEKCFRYIDGAISETDPDLIIITGDLVYGEFDDSGRIFQKLVAYFSKLGIPWAPIFGNHDNESQMGVTWQCAQLENAPNCLFKRGELTGNGNYSIGIKQGDRFVRVLYMMDSNGCDAAFKDLYGSKDENGDPLVYNDGEKVKTTLGFGTDQMQWIREHSAAVDQKLGYQVPKFLCCHMPITQYADAACEAGYHTNNRADNASVFEIGKDVPAKNGDFGYKGEYYKGIHDEFGLWEIMKENHFDGMFVGHSHLNSTSVLYDGIRLTFGLKSSEFDRFDEDRLGGTLITVSSQGTFEVKHIYVK